MNIKDHYVNQFNALATPKWKRAPLPEDLFNMPVASADVAIEGEHPKVNILPLGAIEEEPNLKAYLDYLNEKGSHQKSIGEKFSYYISGHSRNAYFIQTKATGYDVPVIKLSYLLNQASSYAIEHLIVAEAGAKLELILDIHSDSESKARYFGKTVIVAKAGSEVKLVKVQRLSSVSETFDLNLSIVDEGGTVQVVDLQVGSGYKAISNESELNGRHAKSEVKAAYYGEKEENLDLSYTMTHGAKQTESVILAKGALADKASKVFRGNLFFKTGASESVGKEQEFVTLLSPSVKSDSFPALMCSEDDVIGEHAASIGQVDLEKLFYLMSRGLSEVEAKRLMVKASFEEILSEISDQSLYLAVSEALDRRIG